MAKDCIVYQDMMLTNHQVFGDVQLENHRQLEKWGVQIHRLAEWHLFLSEEVGELAEAIGEHVYRNGEKEDIYKEAIQVATLALKIAEMVGDSK